MHNIHWLVLLLKRQYSFRWQQQFYRFQIIEAIISFYSDYNYIGHNANQVYKLQRRNWKKKKRKAVKVLESKSYEEILKEWEIITGSE